MFPESFSFVHLITLADEYVIEGNSWSFDVQLNWLGEVTAWLSIIVKQVLEEGSVK